MKLLGLILANACLHGMAKAWMDGTETGRGFRAFIVTWRTDSLLYLILCGFTVTTYAMLAILLLGLTLKELGL